MAEIEAAVKSILSAHAGTAAIVGTKIFMDQAVQNTQPPFVVYQRILGEFQHAMGQDTGLANALIQVSYVAREAAGAITLAIQGRLALRDYNGTAAGVVIQRAFIENEYSLGFDIQMQSFTRQQDFRIWYREN